MITDDLHQRETRIPIGDSTIEIPAATMEIRQTEIAIPMTTTTQLDADFHVHRGAITMATTMASRMAKAIQATLTTPDPGSATRILIVRKMAPATTKANTTDPIRSRAKATIDLRDGECHVRQTGMTTATTEMATMETETAATAPMTMDNQPLPVGITQVQSSVRRIRARMGGSETATGRDNSRAIQTRKPRSAMMFPMRRRFRVHQTTMTMETTATTVRTTIVDNLHPREATIPRRDNAIRTHA